MNGTRIFSFGDRNVGVVEIDGKPWFIARDVCRILGIQNTSQAVKNLDTDEKGVCQIYTPGGNQKVTAISESGLYYLIQRSTKPQAREFDKWIRKTVLVSLSKDGFYAEDAESELRMIHAISGRMLEQQSKLREHDKRLEEHDRKFEEYEKRYELPESKLDEDLVN